MILFFKCLLGYDSLLWLIKAVNSQDILFLSKYILNLILIIQPCSEQNFY